MLDVFISDCHIGSSFSNGELLSSFLEANKPYIDTLHLVGDIFDLWRGTPDKASLLMFSGFKKIVYYAGNHDADIGIASIFSSNAVDSCVHIRNNKYVFISHGHEFDTSYGRKTPWNLIADTSMDFLSRCLGVYLRNKFRWLSDYHYRTGGYLDKAEQCLDSYGCDYYIYGHTHMPGVLKRNSKTLINLGSWFDEPMALFCTEENYALINVTKDHLRPETEDFNHSW